MRPCKVLSHSCFIFTTLVTEIFKNVFGMKRRYVSDVRIDGRVVVITGANTGIGKETALQLSLRGAKIIIGCRDLKKGENAINDIRLKNSKADLILFKLDLSSFQSVRQFAQKVFDTITSIDILINNAGVFMCPKGQTEDGFETHFGTNHLGHFLLTLTLMPLLKKSRKARVINVSSQTHMNGRIYFENINLKNEKYVSFRAYSQSKLANILFTRELAKRLRFKSNITVYSLHPGLIDSDIGRHMIFVKLLKFFMKIFFIDCELGSQTTLYCALEETLEDESGHYYNDCKRVDKMLKKALNDNVAQRLWDMSEEMVQLENKLKI